MHATDFALLGVNMDDGRGTGEVEQRVALAHRLTQAGADGEDEVRLARMGDEAGIGADAEIADEIRMRPVEQGLPAEGDTDR